MNKLNLNLMPPFRIMSYKKLINVVIAYIYLKTQDLSKILDFLRN